MFRIFIRLVVLVGLIGAIAPESANASCGDWLEHSRSRIGDAPSNDNDRAKDAQSLPSNGPQCRQAPESPVFSDGFELSLERENVFANHGSATIAEDQ